MSGTELSLEEMDLKYLETAERFGIDINGYNRIQFYP
jgi:hypothetical protein